MAAFKPVVTGLDEEPGEFGRDHELLAVGGERGSDARRTWRRTRFGPPVSPHLAAELAGDHDRAGASSSRAARAAAASSLVCEGVGGLLVPITPGYLVRDLALDLELPVVVAARTGLGTINHTLLTVEAARAAGLRVAGVVMTPWPGEPSAMERLEPSDRRAARRRSR